MLQMMMMMMMMQQIRPAGQSLAIERFDHSLV
jgi:hypothetical protein